ncbi:hypothetical protein M2103_000547 [Ereboglobus sp. PH5-5]|uniref:hypothetical protein n=1 Tax=Ereboglobus sp. PH5-5 TaxID=2940529 RepID=UPI0024068F2E|nr:hypothetical protein [Ereboglobus sp. PH5-5]MDF9832337.1 hypothetical protein [Ereboglobus sp. PH5-5]
MNITKRFIVFAGIAAITLSCALGAAPEKTTEPKAPASVTVQKGELKIERNGAKVTLTWTLPPGEWKSLEILRNDKPVRKGAPRVKAVRFSPAKYVDEVPDAGTQYWYWLKLGGVDGKGVNIGPVEAK